MKKILSPRKKFRQIDYLVISLVKPLISRNFCQKSLRVNFRNFHTVCFTLYAPVIISMVTLRFVEFSGQKVIMCVNSSHAFYIIKKTVDLFNSGLCLGHIFKLEELEFSNENSGHNESLCVGLNFVTDFFQKLESLFCIFKSVDHGGANVYQTQWI